MDESGTEVLELVHKMKDSGPINEWDTYYQSTSSDSIEK